MIPTITTEFVMTETAERLRSYLLESERRNTVLLGPPGSGKTTLLRYLAHYFRDKQKLVIYVPLREVETLDRLVAVVIRELLAELDSPSRSNLPPQVEIDHIRDFGSRFMNSPRSDAPEVLGRLFELLAHALGPEGSVYLFLDGLDEIIEPGRIALLIERLVRREQPALRLLVASRPIPETDRLQRSGPFQSFTLGGFTNQEVAALLKRLVPGHDFSMATVDTIFSLAGGSPLLLKLIASAVLVSGELPQLSAEPETLLVHYIDLAIDQVVILSGAADDTRLVLMLLAMFQPVSLSFLAEKSGLDLDRVRAIIEVATRSGIASIDYEHLVFTHVALAEHLLDTYFDAKHIELTDLRFGDEAAERDGLLESSFMPPRDLQKIISGDKTIILGDRGSGKSAIFQALQQFAKDSVVQNDGNGRPMTAIIATSQHPANFLQQVTADDAQVSSAERFKALWLLFTAVLAAREVHRIDDDTTAIDRSYGREARSILRQIGWGDSIKGESRISRWWTSIRSFLPAKVKFGVGPVTVEPNWAQNSRSSKSGSHVQIITFLQRTEVILHTLKRHLLVVFDQIDEAYKYERETQESLVQGLLLAESWLSQTKSIRLVALLRTDLYEIYDIQEKNKFVSRTVRLEWSWQDLITLMLKRLYSNECLSHVVDALARMSIDHRTIAEIQLRVAFPSDVESLPFAQWLFEGLRNGNGRVSPRQVILFLNLTRDSLKVAPGRLAIPLFTEINVSEALTQLSEYSYQEVISDFRVATSFVRSCRAGKISTFDLAEVESLFNVAEGSIALQVERLERLGFLERLVVREGDELESRFRIPPLFTRCWERAPQ